MNDIYIYYMWSFVRDRVRIRFRCRFRVGVRVKGLGLGLGRHRIRVSSIRRAQETLRRRTVSCRERNPYPYPKEGLVGRSHQYR